MLLSDSLPCTGAVHPHASMIPFSHYVLLSFMLVRVGTQITHQQLFAGGNHKSNMHWEASIPPVIAHMKPTRGSLDHEREECVSLQSPFFLICLRSYAPLGGSHVSTSKASSSVR